MDQGSSLRWYLIGTVIILALGLWYFYGKQESVIDTQSSAIEQTQLPALSTGDTTADISADLNQTPDDSAALDQDAAASAQAVQGF
jgi:uncharacterized protein HemX